MTETNSGTETGKENVATRYRVEVGEEFPLSERERRSGCEMHGHWQGREWKAEWKHEWRGRERHGHGPEWRLPGAVKFALALVVLVALVSAAASYPLAVLAVVLVLFLFARGPRSRRSWNYRDWDYRDRDGRDAA
ncbi:hypothetical protein Plav_0120 [Parvibaculum lavamentivorans DS-1]|uniref:Transmembrane protein n=1 Tax=Parvibaculum lavamentivorans (strain DS-1 / DSM 13023 / NCIMB 13966) TaxID=402881 RepID=A7HPB0_PARL1|nr:hypothetical protein [Parvibaculum lavamentivorans]ABS61743.1 hypothetical protein Plav_0120 [Parvibaculum lavamentivorans DS-1]